MEIKLQYDGKGKKIEFATTNIILGSNSTGKTSILKLLHAILEGDNNESLINGIHPTEDFFNIIHLKEDRDINAEVELKSKTMFYNDILKRFILDNEDELTEYAESFTEEIRKLFYARTKYEYTLSKNEIKIRPDKLEKLANLIFTLQLSNKSKSSLEEFYFRFACEQLSSEKLNIILIDDVDRYLDHILIQNILLDIINTNKDIMFILTTNNKYILNNIETDFIYNTQLETIDLVKNAKIKMYQQFYKTDETELTLDEYIHANEQFYFTEDYEIFLQKNKLNIINELNI